jgi:hypothetical protein
MSINAPAVFSKSVSIKKGESLSSSLNCTKQRPSCVYMPSDWDHANITFQVSPDSVTYFDLYNYRGALITRDVVPNVCINLTGVQDLPLGWYKIRSGTSDKPINQSDDRMFIVTME